MFTKTFISFANTWDLNIPRIEESMLRGMKPGKILRREILLSRPDYKAADMLKMLDGAIQDGLAALYAAEYVPEVKFAYSREKIEEIYADENCPSCMSGAWANEVAGEFYAANGFVVAYRHNGKNVTARCVTYGKTFSEAYGPESAKLIAALEESDYTRNIPFEKWTSFQVPFHNGKYYIPYLDGSSGCFIPYADRHDVKNSSWECLFLPLYVDDGFNDLEDVEEFKKLKEYIEQGSYMDVLIEHEEHGKPSKVYGALSVLEKYLQLSEDE